MGFVVTWNILIARVWATLESQARVQLKVEVNSLRFTQKTDFYGGLHIIAAL
jgi:hypothetical protein